MNLSHSYPSPAKAWWAMVVLFLAYTLSFIDRTILALLVEPLRRDLGLSDTEISLLHGLAFAIFYSTMGVPIAVLSDKRSRRLIIGVGVFFWSLMTVLCGVATSFWKLFAARLGVGVGEATLGPATYSLVADLFPEHLRGKAMGFFATGIHVGAGLALIVGGAIVGMAAGVGEIETAVGTFRSWQLVFFIVGAPGLIIALLCATMIEPKRIIVAKTVETATSEL
ncbi:MAG: MFS transporter, partial [Rhodospirillaceae bacterium]|nr:MFS transporter [Rhodospirillaceae bacterium]